MQVLSNSLKPYLEQYREMLSHRNVTKSTRKSYPTYLLAYLSYLDDVLHKLPIFLSIRAAQALGRHSGTLQKV